MTGFSFLPCRTARQRGIALLTALLLMLAVLMTGIAAARAAMGAARISGHERERMLALHGAMAGLRDAEHDIEGGLDPASVRALALAHADPAAFAEDCRGGSPYDGLCRQASSEDILALLADPQGPGVALGAFSGARMPLGGGALAVQPPRYLIELMPSSADAMLYRITALGFGSADTSQAAVQAYYRKLLPEGASSPGQDAPGGPGAPGGPDTPGAPASEGAPDSGPPLPDSADPPQAPDAPGTPGGPGIRVGWREIGNWQDTMAAHSARTERR